MKTPRLVSIEKRMEILLSRVNHYELQLKLSKERLRALTVEYSKELEKQ